MTMAKFIGRQQAVGIAREATRGTLVAPTLWVPKVSYSVEDKALVQPFAGSYGILPGGADDIAVTQKWAEGDMETEMTDKVIGLLAYALFGTLSSGSFNSAYKHTLTVQNSVQPTTLSLVMNDPISAGATPAGSIAYAMAMLNSMEIKMEMGQLVKVVTNFIAKGHTDYTYQTPTFSQENKFNHSHLSFKLAATSSSLATQATNLDAASKIKLQSLTLKIERSVIRENALGTVQPIDILARGFKISGSVKLTYADRTYRDYMLNGTKKCMRIALNNTGATVGATTPQFQIDLPYVFFDQWKSDAPNDEVATQDIDFMALYDIDNSVIIGTNTFVVNAQASY